MAGGNCSNCNKKVEASRTGQRYCTKCHNAYMRKNRRRHSELTDVQRKKANCRSYANVYIKRGKLIKMPCEICGDKKTEMHHEDYDKPLSVRWFCRKHHMAKHI